MIKMTDDEFESKNIEAEERFEKHPTDPYFPSPSEMEEINAEPEKFYDYIIYLTATNPRPVTDAEKESDKAMNDFIRRNTKFVEK